AGDALRPHGALTPAPAGAGPASEVSGQTNCDGVDEVAKTDRRWWCFQRGERARVAPQRLSSSWKMCRAFLWCGKRVDRSVRLVRVEDVLRGTHHDFGAPSCRSARSCPARARPWAA